MNRTTIVSNSRQDDNKMKKYIVEAPELKAGQKIGPGGVREHGRMKTQFSNPIPYEESVRHYRIKDNNRISSLLSDCVTSLAESLLKGYVVPVLSAKISQSAQERIASFTQPKVIRNISSASVIIDVEPIELPREENI